MALNCVSLDGNSLSPIPLPNENFLFRSEKVSLLLECGNGYPGNSSQHKCNNGVVYISNHRIVYVNSSVNQSSSGSFVTFSVPLTYTSDIKYQQPIFGSNYYQAEVECVPGGNLVSGGILKLYFKENGGYEFFSVHKSMMERILETGEIPMHHEPLPSYYSATGQQEPVSNRDTVNALPSNSELPPYSGPPENFVPDLKTQK
ncbi:hypothetical protein BB558_001917 [Smittium angustum]|uniref:GRAM domain-containing protein n=1 Tax=Smittium angustum TaxID=133377 RepID=A0A2U1JA16_SMIAN|nr:hypothetical protein BB558_001917 [Smittium angustum]